MDCVPVDQNNWNLLDDFSLANLVNSQLFVLMLDRKRKGGNMTRAVVSNVSTLFVITTYIVVMIIYQQSSLVDANLAAEMARKEQHVRNICSSLREYYLLHRNSPEEEFNCANIGGCDVNALNRESSFVCSDGFGNSYLCNCNQMKLSKKLSVLITAPNTQTTFDVKKFSCASNTITRTFEQNQERDERLKWQFVGSNLGAHISYPARSWRTELQGDCFQFGTCPIFDPRYRPWFIGASSGPKNVVLLLDTSKSMGSILNVMKSAAGDVVDGLGYLDSFAIVTFNKDVNTCRNFAQTGGKPTLHPASIQNKQRFHECINGLSVSDDDTTDLVKAFNEAFDILDNSWETTSKCHSAILFLTDGEKGSSADPSISIQQKLNDLPFEANVFTFTVGEGADTEIPQRIACNTGGVYTRIQSANEIRDRMSRYYQYYSDLKTNYLTSQGEEDHVIWSEVYQDFSGLGRMSTVASPCNLEGIQVGVAGVDVLLSDLLATGSSEEDIREELRKTGMVCPRGTILQASQLSRLRGEYPCEGFNTRMFLVLLFFMGGSLCIFVSITFLGGLSMYIYTVYEVGFKDSKKDGNAAGEEEEEMQEDPSHSSYTHGSFSASGAPPPPPNPHYPEMFPYAMYGGGNQGGPPPPGPPPPPGAYGPPQGFRGPPQGFHGPPNGPYGPPNGPYGPPHEFSGNPNHGNTKM